MLIVSHEMALLHPLVSLSESNSWHLETAANGWEAMERVQSDVVPHLLLLDLPRGDGNSLHILRWLRRLRPDLPVVVVCQAEDADRQKEATRLGAAAVLVRPFDENLLESVIRRNLEGGCKSVEKDIASDDMESLGDDEFFLSVNPVMQKLRAQAELLAQADVPVLIVGESGSGKATVARLIHKLSIRSGFNFLRVNCAAMPAELLEIELFGRRNSPGDAYELEAGQTGHGKLGMAEKGTLLLEEITAMTPSLQSRILQVMQGRQFLPSRRSRPIATDVRILATTSARLDQALAEQKLREDLYYRLSAFMVHVPPLRQRKEEVKIFLQYFMHKLAHHYGLPPREFTPQVMKACADHSWPGNLQEVETFIKCYLVAGDEKIVLNEMETDAGVRSGTSQILELPLNADRDFKGGAGRAKSLKSLIQSVKSETERNAIAVALEKTSWNRKAAARLLQMSYRSLLYKIQQYHMNTSEPYVSRFLGGSASRGNGKAS
jgi:two-component system, NtrC family, response regulator AtoC